MNSIFASALLEFHRKVSIHCLQTHAECVFLLAWLFVCLVRAKLFQYRSSMHLSNISFFSIIKLIGLSDRDFSLFDFNFFKSRFPLYMAVREKCTALRDRRWIVVENDESFYLDECTVGSRLFLANRQVFHALPYLPYVFVSRMAFQIWLFYDVNKSVQDDDD